MLLPCTMFCCICAFSAPVINVPVVNFSLFGYSGYVLTIILKDNKNRHNTIGNVAESVRGWGQIYQHIVAAAENETATNVSSISVCSFNFSSHYYVACAPTCLSQAEFLRGYLPGKNVCLGNQGKSKTKSSILVLTSPR
jgi:hypothetical protein